MKDNRRSFYQKFIDDSDEITIAKIELQKAIDRNATVEEIRLMRLKYEVKRGIKKLQ